MVVLERIFSLEEQQRFLIDEKYVRFDYELFFINDNSSDYEEKIEEIIKTAEEMEDLQFIAYRYLYDLSVELMVYGTKEALETLLDHASLSSKVKARKIYETRDVNSIDDLIDKIQDAIYKDDPIIIHNLADLLKEKLPESLDPLIIKAQAFEKEGSWEKAVLLWEEFLKYRSDEEPLYSFLYPHDWEGTSSEEHLYAYAIAHLLYGHYKLDAPDGIKYFQPTDIEDQNGELISVDIYDSNFEYEDTLEHLYYALTDEVAFKDGADCLNWLFKHFDGLEDELNSALGLD